MNGDVLTLLKNDHLAVESLLEQFDDLSAGGRDDYFCEVVQTLVGHEVAEELVVYPLIKKADPAGAEIANARLSEQAEAEDLLSDMESEDTTSAEFATKFNTLRSAVLAHAEAEESTVFQLLESSTTMDEREELGRNYLKAKKQAPTHPHPHAPDTPPGNKVLGPVAAMYDRTRDALKSA